MESTATKTASSLRKFSTAMSMKINSLIKCVRISKVKWTLTTSCVALICLQPACSSCSNDYAGQSDSSSANNDFTPDSGGSEDAVEDSNVTDVVSDFDVETDTSNGADVPDDIHALCLSVSQDHISVENVSVAEESEYTFYIENCGVASAVVHVEVDQSLDGLASVDDASVTVEPGSRVEVSLLVYSDHETTLSGDVRVTSDDDYLHTISVEGSIFDPDACPTASISVVEEGSRPYDYFHLSGSASVPATPDAAIRRYTWVVEPEEGLLYRDNVGSEFYFSAARSYTTYTAKLTVEDVFGRTSCDEASFEAVIGSRAGLQVEAWWDVDVEEPLGPGVDMNLRLVHPDGWWRDPTWDCNASNPRPFWASFEVPDVGNPVLTNNAQRSSQTEQLEMASPDNLVYRLGLHGFGAFPGYEGGPVRSHVRVLLDGEILLEESSDVRIGEFWYIGDIDINAARVEYMDIMYDSVPFPP